MAINFILSKFFSQFTKASCPCKLFYQYFYEWYFFPIQMDQKAINLIRSLFNLLPKEIDLNI